ncbi:MAG: MBL fold metallo-hydrolase [Lentisphaeria bacterium]
MIPPLSSQSKTIGVTTLGSGSKGNATLIHYGNCGILVDAGFSLKELRRRLNVAHIDESIIKAIIITHEHSDHIKGLRVCASYFSVPIYASTRCADTLMRKDPKIHTIHRFTPGGTFMFKDYSITPFDIKHDAIEPVAFVIRIKNKKIGIATDLGSVTKMTEYQLNACDFLIIESNHDLNMLAASPRPWHLKQRILSPIGHLNNNATQDFLTRVIGPNTHYITLAHISHECNTNDIAFNTTEKTLQDLGRQDIHLEIANQEQPTPTLWLSL